MRIGEPFKYSWFGKERVITPVMVFNIDPVAAPRMTQQDKWRPTEAAKKSYRFRNALKLLSNKVKYQLPEDFNVLFVMPMPPSWSETRKKGMDLTPHQQRPDRDNLVKNLQDALCKDDGYICGGRVDKIWGRTGAIIIW